MPTKKFPNDKQVSDLTRQDALNAALAEIDAKFGYIRPNPRATLPVTSLEWRVVSVSTLKLPEHILEAGWWLIDDGCEFVCVHNVTRGTVSYGIRRGSQKPFAQAVAENDQSWVDGLCAMILAHTQLKVAA